MIVCIGDGHSRKTFRGLILGFVGCYFSLSWFVWQESPYQGAQGLIPSATTKKESSEQRSELSFVISVLAHNIKLLFLAFPAIGPSVQSLPALHPFVEDSHRVLFRSVHYGFGLFNG